MYYRRCKKGDRFQAAGKQQAPLLGGDGGWVINLQMEQGLVYLCIGS
jgi:hypothetical protein